MPRSVRALTMHGCRVLRYGVRSLLWRPRPVLLGVGPAAAAVLVLVAVLVTRGDFTASLSDVVAVFVVGGDEQGRTTKDVESRPSWSSNDIGHRCTGIRSPGTTTRVCHWMAKVAAAYRDPTATIAAACQPLSPA